MFYNGTKKVEDRSEFRLSSAYENPTEDPDLELRVTMLNVNDGHNNELMEHCQTLKEYAQYVARVRKYAADPDIVLEEAVERAVEECIMYQRRNSGRIFNEEQSGSDQSEHL